MLRSVCVCAKLQGELEIAKNYESASAKDIRMKICEYKRKKMLKIIKKWTNELHYGSSDLVIYKNLYIYKYIYIYLLSL